MGQNQSGMGFPGGEDGKKKKPEKKKWQPPAPPTRVGKKVKKKGMDGANRLPNVTPASKCMLRKLKLERVKDWLLMEEEFVANQERIKPHTERAEEEKSKLDDLRGSPMSVGNLEEIIDDKCVPSHRTRDEDDRDASASAHGPDLENARDPPFCPRARAVRPSPPLAPRLTHDPIPSPLPPPYQSVTPSFLPPSARSTTSTSCRSWISPSSSPGARCSFTTRACPSSAFSRTTSTRW